MLGAGTPGSGPPVGAWAHVLSGVEGSCWVHSLGFATASGIRIASVKVPVLTVILHCHTMHTSDIPVRQRKSSDASIPCLTNAKPSSGM